MKVRYSKVAAFLAMIALLLGYSSLVNLALADDANSYRASKLASPKGISLNATPISVVVTFNAVLHQVSASSYAVRLYASSGERPLRTITPFTSGGSVADLIPGKTYKITVQAIGNAVNKSNSKESNQVAGTYYSSEESGKISFVTGLPTVSISAFNQPVTSNPTPRFYFDSPNQGGLWCYVDSDVATTCTSVFQTRSLADGIHAFHVYQIVSGVQGPTASFTFTIDHLAPIITNLLIGPGPSYSASWTETSSPGTAITFTCKLDSNSAVSCSSPFAIGALDAGSHAFTVTGEDVAGNSGQASTTVVVSAPSCATGGTCSVGNTGPGNGTVFYHSAAGFNCGPTFSATAGLGGGLCHDLEVAPSTWAGLSDPTLIWSQSLSNVPGIIDDSLNINTHVGLGFMNSIAIVLQPNGITTAAGAARNYDGGSKNDWYLPNIAELNQLCKYVNGQPWVTDASPCNVWAGQSQLLGFLDGAVPNPVTGYYWASSVHWIVDPNSGPPDVMIQNDQGAMVMYFDGGSKTAGYKAQLGYVRAIRAF